MDIPDLAGGDFSRLTITRQLAVMERATAAEPVLLAGSSMGGYLAALFAARHPEVQRLVLFAPAFRFARRWAETLGAEKTAAWRRTGWLDVFHYGEGRNLPLSYALLEDAAAYEDYPAVPQPALIFHGANDLVVPPRYSQEFAAAHPNARLEIVPSGHELTDVLDYMAPKVTAFLLDPALP